MTTIFDKYYSSIESGIINIYDGVNFSVVVCDKTDKPQEKDTITDIIGIIQTYVNLIKDKDIITLTMGEIIEKIENQLTDEFKKEARTFVVYDTLTNILCFSEEFRSHLGDK